MYTQVKGPAAPKLIGEASGESKRNDDVVDGGRDPHDVPLTEKVWVKVLHNTSNPFTSFGPTDGLRSTVALPAKPGPRSTTHGDVLLWVFEQTNIDEPNEFFGRLYRQGRNRSLSVGDVVMIGDDVAWACEMDGWREVSVDEDQLPERPALVVQDPHDGMAYVINAFDAFGEPIEIEV